MTDTGEIVGELRRAAVRAEPCVLATVVRTMGSAYRGVGAQAVIRADGSTVGLVSGGCLEADLAARAPDVLAAGARVTVLYDARSPDDLVWGLGLGCEGLVEILLEPLQPADSPALADFLDASCDPAGETVVAIVHCGSGDASRVAPRLRIDRTGTVTALGGRVNPAVHAHIVRDARSGARLPAGTRGWSCTYDDDAIAVAFMRVQPPVHLLLCGAGLDAASVSRLVAMLGWRCTIITGQASPGVPDRFPGAAVAVVDGTSALRALVACPSRTAAVIMSHRYERDAGYLRMLLETDVGYIGALGPRRRTERMLAELGAPPLSGGEGGASEMTGVADASGAAHGTRGTVSTRVFGPAGLDIGGDDPELVALAIIAEVAAVMNGRSGGHLRDRSAAIHDRPGAPVARPSAAARSAL